MTTLKIFFIFLFTIKLSAQDRIFLAQCDSLLLAYQSQAPICTHQQDTIDIVRKLVKTVLQDQNISPNDSLLFPENLNCHLINYYSMKMKGDAFFYMALKCRKLPYKCLQTSDLLNNATFLPNTLDSLLSFYRTTDTIQQRIINQLFLQHYYLPPLRFNDSYNLALRKPIISQKYPYKIEGHYFFFHHPKCPTDIAVSFYNSVALVILDNDVMEEYYYFYDNNTKIWKFDAGSKKLHKALKRKHPLQVR